MTVGMLVHPLAATVMVGLLACVGANVAAIWKDRW